MDSTTLDASPDAIWEACKHADELLPKAMPEFLTSSTFLQGHGEPGSIRVVKMGPGMKIPLLTHTITSTKNPTQQWLIDVGSRLVLSFSLMNGQEEDLIYVEVLQALIPPFVHEFCCAAIPHAGEVTERMDLFDEASKTLGYTVLQGDIPGTATSAPPWSSLLGPLLPVPLMRPGLPLMYLLAIWVLRSTSSRLLSWSRH